MREPHNKHQFRECIQKICLGFKRADGDEKYLNLKIATKLEHLGSGAYASAFHVSRKNFVVKATIDAKDASNTAKLQQYQKTHETKFFPKILTRIYKLWNGKLWVYIWAVEKLDTLEINDSRDFLFGCKSIKPAYLDQSYVVSNKWFKLGVQARETLKKMGALKILTDTGPGHNNMIHPRKNIPMFNDLGLYHFKKLPEARILVAVNKPKKKKKT